MKLLRKARATKPKVTVGDTTKLILNINALKEKGAIKTTPNGVFYTFPEIIKAGARPDLFAKNLFTYARHCKLIKQGQTLYIRDIEENDLLCQYSVKHGYVSAS